MSRETLRTLGASGRAEIEQKGKRDLFYRGEYEATGYKRHVTLKLTNHAGAASAEFVIVGKRTNGIDPAFFLRSDLRLAPAEKVAHY